MNTERVASLILIIAGYSVLLYAFGLHSFVAVVLGVHLIYAGVK